jgi:hypothetical protein
MLVVVSTHHVANRASNKSGVNESDSFLSDPVRPRGDHDAAMSTLNIQAAAARWVDDHGECLYRYALVRVRKPEVAEDLVQETLLAAVRGYENSAAAHPNEAGLSAF